MACNRCSNSSGGNRVSTTATPLTNHGWSDRGTGAERYHRDRHTIRILAAAIAESAASQVRCGVLAPRRPRLAPMPINIGDVDRAATVDTTLWGR